MPHRTCNLYIMLYQPQCNNDTLNPLPGSLTTTPPQAFAIMATDHLTTQELKNILAKLIKTEEFKRIVREEPGLSAISCYRKQSCKSLTVVRSLQ